MWMFKSFCCCCWVETIFDRAHKLRLSIHIIFGLTCHPFSIYVFWMCYAQMCVWVIVLTLRKRMPKIFFFFQTRPCSKFVVLCDLLRLNKLLHPQSNPFDFDQIYWIQVDFACLLALSIILSRIRLVLFSKIRCQFGLWPENNLCINFFPPRNILFI